MPDSEASGTWEPDPPGFLGVPLRIDPDLDPGIVWITDGDGIPLAIGVLSDER